MKKTGKFILVILVVSLFIISTPFLIAQAEEPPTHFLNEVSASWVAVEGNTTVSGVGTNEIYWGGSSSIDRSGLKFTGITSQSFEEGVAFPLGTLTHLNRNSEENPATGATLQIALDFHSPTLIPQPVINVDFMIDETVNLLITCWWFTPSGAPYCDDYVTFPSTFDNETFTVDNKIFTLTIEGFVDSSGNTIQKLTTIENANSEAVLMASLTSVTLPKPEIRVVKQTNYLDSPAAPGAYLYVGDPVSWQYTVQNSGDVDLTAITLIDDHQGTIICPHSTLIPGEQMTCAEASGTVIQGQYTNTATVVASHSSGTVTHQDTSYYYGISPKLTLNNYADPQVFNAINEEITYTFSVKNTGNATLMDVMVLDDLTNTIGLVVSPSTLAPGDIGTATTSYTITQKDLDTGTIQNNAIVTAKDPNDSTVTDQDTETISAIQNKSLTLLKSVLPSTYTSVGDQINYTYTLTNNGNVTLVAPFTIIDNKVPVSCPSSTASLAPAKSMTCSATYFVTQQDVDNGVLTNTAIAYADDGAVQSNQTLVTITGPEANLEINLDKSANPNVFHKSGEKITYSFMVTNSSNVTLQNIIITDPLFTLSFGPITLAPDENHTFTYEHSVTQADVNLGRIENTATVSGHFNDEYVSNYDTEIATVSSQDPELTLIKSANTVTFKIAGELVVFSFNVTNTGNLTLHNIVINDPLTGSYNLPISPASLDPGETGIATATYTTTTNDVLAGLVNNSATATGLTASGEAVSETDSFQIDFLPDPRLFLKISPTPLTYAEPGDLITYSFSAENVGNVTLTNVMIDDLLTGSNNLLVSPSTLAPGEIGIATATYEITSDDCDAESVFNEATAKGSYNNLVYTANDDDRISLYIHPEISLKMATFPKVYYKAGDLITISYEVTNTGNVTIINVTISDTLFSVVDIPIIPSSLAPGESGTAFTSYFITNEDVSFGSVSNEATATGYFNNIAYIASEKETITYENNPALTLEKSADPSIYTQIGEKINYTFTVTNTGNVSLSNLLLTDTKAGVSELSITPSSLAPGETGTASIEYFISQDDITNGKFINDATVVGDYNGNQYQAFDFVNITYGPQPKFDLELTADPEKFSQIGEVITYTFNVTNTGTAKLTNIRINDTLTGCVDILLSPPNLDLGEKGTVSAKYLISKADLDAGEVLNQVTTLADFNNDILTTSHSITIRMANIESNTGSEKLERPLVAPVTGSPDNPKILILTTLNGFMASGFFLIQWHRKRIKPYQ